MSQPQLTPQQEALAQELLRALRQGTDDLLAQIARTLAATTDATLFGDTELKLRDLAHLIAARAYSPLSASRSTSSMPLGGRRAATVRRGRPRSAPSQRVKAAGSRARGSPPA